MSHDETTLAVEALPKPRKWRARKPAIPRPPVVEAPDTMSWVSLIYLIANDGSRLGFILVGPDPFKWAQGAAKLRFNWQVPRPEGEPRVAPSELQCFFSELTRHRAWESIYVEEPQLLPTAGVEEGKKRVAKSAANRRVYLVGTLEADS